MIKIGITGQSGFIGTHLFNTLGLSSDMFTRIPFRDSYFSNTDELASFVTKCDVIVHLAAVNRHEDPRKLYQTNIDLVKQLISACEITSSTPHIIFSSSIQEESDNFYGKSKKEGRELFQEWAKRNRACFTGFIIPNVYGPFGNPYSNSVVSTFCYQLTHNEHPEIIINNETKLIYIAELVKEILNQIILKKYEHQKETIIDIITVCHTSTIKVSTLLEKLEGYKHDYFNCGIIPNLKHNFDRNLFNTFLCYIDLKLFFPFILRVFRDNRGSFVEMAKLTSGGQISLSITGPNITRGNHFHTRKAERFVVIKGKARIHLRRIGTDTIISFDLDGDKASFIDIPIWFTHSIINIGKDELYTIFWINEFFDPNDPDTYYEQV